MKMSDIARIAGVSESTVSRALNDSPLISEQTRAKIKGIAAKQNYSINTQARNFRLQKTHIISAIITFEHAPKQHISDPFFMDMLGSVADHLTEHGYDLLISRVRKHEWSKKIQQRQMDGAVFLGQSMIHDELNELAANSNFPFIVWGAHLDDLKYTCISSDNVKGSFDAVSHLLRIGRKRIAFLGDITAPEAKLRYDGYSQAIIANGFELAPELHIPASFAGETAYNAMRQFLSKGIPFDAVFATSDVLGMNAIKAMYDVGMRVPEDASLVGFDDISMSAYCTPPLTTVRQNIFYAGRLIAESLLKKINGEEVESIILPAELIVRST